jgi:hypothetical protein
LCIHAFALIFVDLSGLTKERAALLLHRLTAGAGAPPRVTK